MDPPPSPEAQNPKPHIPNPKLRSPEPQSSPKPLATLTLNGPKPLQGPKAPKPRIEESLEEAGALAVSDLVSDSAARMACGGFPVFSLGFLLFGLRV